MATKYLGDLQIFLFFIANSGVASILLRTTWILFSIECCYFFFYIEIFWTIFLIKSVRGHEILGRFTNFLFFQRKLRVLFIVLNQMCFHVFFFFFIYIEIFWTIFSSLSHVRNIKNGPSSLFHAILIWHPCFSTLLTNDSRFFGKPRKGEKKESRVFSSSTTTTTVSSANGARRTIYSCSISMHGIHTCSELCISSNIPYLLVMKWDWEIVDALSSKMLHA